MFHMRSAAVLSDCKIARCIRGFAELWSTLIAAIANGTLIVDHAAPLFQVPNELASCPLNRATLTSPGGREPIISSKLADNTSTVGGSGNDVSPGGRATGEGDDDRADGDWMSTLVLPSTWSEQLAETIATDANTRSCQLVDVDDGIRPASVPHSVAGTESAAVIHRQPKTGDATAIEYVEYSLSYWLISLTAAPKTIAQKRTHSSRIAVKI